MDLMDPLAAASALVAAFPWQFRAFVAALCFYHLSEYGIAWAFNRETLSRDSWLLSRQYVVAMSAGCVEYAVELALFPGFKRGDVGALRWIARIGLAMVVWGDALRKAAQITARHNFTHQIQFSRRPTHRVVSHGVYAWCRHPGYLGWLTWSVGTQVMLIVSNLRGRIWWRRGGSSRRGYPSRRGCSVACSPGSTRRTRRGRGPGYRAYPSQPAAAEGFRDGVN